MKLIDDDDRALLIAATRLGVAPWELDKNWEWVNTTLLFMREEMYHGAHLTSAHRQFVMDYAKREVAARKPQA